MIAHYSRQGIAMLQRGEVTDPESYDIAAEPERERHQAHLVLPANEIRLTQAQVSALQCACIDADFEPLVTAAWPGSDRFRFDTEDAQALAAELTELANSEDARAIEGDRAARAACTALTNLAVKVRMAVR